MDVNNTPDTPGTVSVDGVRRRRHEAVQFLQHDLALENAVRSILYHDAEAGVERVRRLVEDVVAAVQGEQPKPEQQQGGAGS